MDLRSIRGRVAIVTGAASGMGLATAALFAREGARVVLTDLDQARCDACAEAIRAEGGEVLALALDIADASAIGRVVEEVARQLGGIDIIVNNAGIYGFESIDAGAAYDGMWGRLSLIHI